MTQITHGVSRRQGPTREKTVTTFGTSMGVVSRTESRSLRPSAELQEEARSNYFYLCRLNGSEIPTDGETSWKNPDQELSYAVFYPGRQLLSYLQARNRAVLVAELDTLQRSLHAPAFNLAAVELTAPVITAQQGSAALHPQTPHSQNDLRPAASSGLVA